MIDVFAEYGVMGVVVALFATQMMFLQKTLMGKLREVENITIKLIDRWNKADDRQDRRHEKILEEMNDITDEINFVKGRINGGPRG
tara:strand:+ start:233 stop:490 length:258 start_codon:yes stop_codon:yes gene_type:complete